MSFRSFAKKYAPKKEHKYGASRTERAGYSFGSKFEAAVFSQYQLEEKAGEITDLKIQQRVYLLKNPDIYYIADFKFLRRGELRYGEAKGYETPEWKLKKKLWEHMGPAPLEIFQGNYARPRLVEILIPKGYSNE